jgi:hypothetical protein
MELSGGIGVVGADRIQGRTENVTAPIGAGDSPLRRTARTCSCSGTVRAPRKSRPEDILHKNIFIHVSEEILRLRTPSAQGSSAH